MDTKFELNIRSLKITSDDRSFYLFVNDALVLKLNHTLIESGISHIKGLIKTLSNK